MILFADLQMIVYGEWNINAINHKVHLNVVAGTNTYMYKIKTYKDYNPYSI